MAEMSFFLRIHEGDHDVARAFGDLEALVEVRQATGMHEHPPTLRVSHRAVVSANENVS